MLCWKDHVSVGKMGIKWRAGPGISILNTGVFDITSKVHILILTDIHTHNIVFLNVYSQRISTWNIGYFSKYHRLVFSRMVPDEMGSKLHCSYELECFVLICFKWTKGIIWLQQSWIVSINKCKYTQFLAPGTCQKR